ncbi:MAG: phage major capsid protein, partial [Sphingomonadales bacterium]|nr:phage major capsid protein [Sphingomonadales bacterium]
SPFVSGLQRLLENNVPLDVSDRNAIMSPRTWGGLENLTATDNQPLMRPRALDNMVFRPTTSIPNDLGVGNDESLAIMGDFRDLVLGVRMEASVEALRLQSFADNLLLEFVGWTRVDFMVRRPASFVVLEGITE